MADDSTRAMDYSFCAVCRKNHDQGRKHIYSKKHKKILDGILTKFSKKIDGVREFLARPSVVDGELEPGAHFWCHFCAKEIDKHVSDREVSITYGGVFEHLASVDHIKKLHRFWREHGAEKELKSKFMIDKEKFQSYKAKVDEKLKLHESIMELKRNKAEELIRQREAIQQQISVQPPDSQQSATTFVVYKTVQNQLGILQNPTGWHDGQRVWGGGIIKYRHGSDQWHAWEMDKLDGTTSRLTCQGPSTSASKLTSDDLEPSASSERLTAIRVPVLPGVKGNIHTGATPPWLRDDDEDEETPKQAAVIGPSFEEFQKHIKRMKKASQNPNRVGANFEREKETSEDWLPSFGRTWNQGPRWQSRHEFRREKGKPKKEN